uniref:Uncharacterized protein n=1 Tax=Cyprinus carpio TaxID=7962 RepID=A0A8C1ZC25_CYPCA
QYKNNSLFKKKKNDTHSVDVCDVILVFCPIVSRAGTDIDAALNELNTCPASKSAIFVVFHLTFDPDKIVPDSSIYVIRRNTLTVNCLFSEDKGLLTCDMNEKALAKIVQYDLEQGTEPPTAPWVPQHKWLLTALCVCVCMCVCSLLFQFFIHLRIFRKWETTRFFF